MDNKFSNCVCKAYFINNTEKVYYSGQKLNIQIALSIPELKSLKGIYVHISGIGYSNWNDQNNNKHQRNEEYFSEKKYLLGGVNENLIVEPTELNFVYECDLPITLPSSIETKNCYIRYNASIVLHNSDGVIVTEDFKHPFTIIKYFALKLNESLSKPVECDIKRRYSRCWMFCCFCQSNPLIIALKLPYSGYVLGQSIEFELNVNNRSHQMIECFHVTIFRVVRVKTFTNSNYGLQDNAEIIDKYIYKKCKSNDRLNFKENIIIPKKLPSTDVLNNICDIQYTLNIDAIIESSWHTNSSLTVPITIGTTSVYYNRDQEPVPNENNNENVVPDTNILLLLASTSSECVEPTLGVHQLGPDVPAVSTNNIEMKVKQDIGFVLKDA